MLAQKICDTVLKWEEVLRRGSNDTGYHHGEAVRVSGRGLNIEAKVETFDSEKGKMIVRDSSGREIPVFLYAGVGPGAIHIERIQEH